jgi:hypothetical protein
MNVRHELAMQGKCPVDDTLDNYTVTVEAERIVKVEDILAAVASLPQPLFQEEITKRLAGELGCTVTTVGYHSGVKTTCKC